MSKEELVEKLLTQGYIDFKQALMLLDHGIGAAPSAWKPRSTYPGVFDQNVNPILPQVQKNDPYWQINSDSKMFLVDLQNPTVTYQS